jgi:exodeoxyribonuclease VII small subunit
MAETKTPQELSFEDALKELETLVERMEHGDLSLDDALRDFERGVTLTRHCQQALKDAEQRVEMLSGKSLDSPLVPFDPGEP